MKKHAIVSMVLAISLGVPVIVPAAKAPQTDATTESEEKEYTFRGIPWGSSIEEVEKSDFLQDHPDYDYDNEYNAITVDDLTVANKSAAAVLWFGDSGLYQVIYYFTDKHSNLNSYVEDFNDVCEALIKKYGEPDRNVDNWKDDLYKDDPSEYGMAVGAGHATFVRQWIGNDSDILFGCSGDNYEIKNIIFYESLSLQPEETEFDDGL